MNAYTQYLLFISFISSTNAWYGDGGILDWIWPHSKDSTGEIGVNSPLIQIPFELKTIDEQFLEEASKLKDIIKSSALDSCQHRVVLKIKTSCSSMTEEELAKMSVNLLNCQSSVDGREIFPCTDAMSLKQCTKKMDPAMWNAYHMMNNRARAVCLSLRQAQFQALSEMTVNKLMSTAHNQIQKMNAIAKSQNEMEKLTLGTINLIEKGNIAFLEQQDQMKAGQQEIKDFISNNLRELVKEKALIAAGHTELAKMTQSIRDKMDEANGLLYEQTGEIVEYHKKLLSDVEAIQKLTKEIFHRIDESTDRLLLQHADASTKYEEAVKNLIKINETVHFLLELIGSTKSEIDEKFTWIQNFLDETGIQIGKISSIAYHISYLLVGMLLSSFLNISTISRVVLTVLVPANLFLSYVDRSDLVLNFTQLTTVLITTVFTIAVVNRLLGFRDNKSSIEYDGSMGKNGVGDNNRRGSNKWFIFRRFFDKIVSIWNKLMQMICGWRRIQREEEDEDDGYSGYYHNPSYFDNLESRNGFDVSNGPTSETPQHARVRNWLQNNKSFLPAPDSSVSSMNSVKQCSAISRSSGKRCRKPKFRSFDYCSQHIRNNSEIG